MQFTSDDFLGLRSKLGPIYFVSRFTLGVSCIVVGIAIGLCGAIAETSIVAQAMGLSTNLNDAAPGAILVFSGAAVVWMSRRRVVTQREGEADSGKPAMVHRRE
jgi:hypothetical protein